MTEDDRSRIVTFSNAFVFAARSLIADFPDRVSVFYYIPDHEVEVGEEVGAEEAKY